MDTFKAYLCEYSPPVFPKAHTHFTATFGECGCTVAFATAIVLFIWLVSRRTLLRDVSMDGPRHNFEVTIDRSAYPTVKHNLADLCLGSDTSGALKLWLADMELPCCPPVQKALIARAMHPDFGYTLKPNGLWRVVGDWLVRHQRWDAAPKDESFVWSATVVSAASTALRTLTEPGEGVLIMTPLYGSLQNIVDGSGRCAVRVAMDRDAGGNYSMDLAAGGAIDRALRRCTAALLCNPHNPTGRVWAADELRSFAALCSKHGVLVIADEIWADWCHAGHLFQPFCNFARRAKCDHVVLGSPSKAWSLGGLHASFAVIEQDDLRRRYLSLASPVANTFGSVGMMAAYEHGEKWLADVKAHVEGNIEYALKYFENHIPEIIPLRPESTYNMWLDCKQLGLNPKELTAFMLEEAQLALESGTKFDPGGSSGFFQRINVACSRKMLEESMERLRSDIIRRRKP